MKRKTLAVAISAATFLLASAGSASASVINYTLDDEFSGSGSIPSGYPTAILDDGGTVGSVRLTMSLSALSASEKVTNWYLNLDNAIDMSLMSASYVSGNAATAVLIGPQDAYKPDGDGLMDILLAFAESGTDAFTGGETAVYDFTAPGLTASSFNLLSNCLKGCGSGSHVMAAHVQGITGGGSAWMGTSGGDEPPLPPQEIAEPQTLALLGVALFITGYGVRRHGRRHAQDAV